MKTIYLHMGFHKTATSSFQDTCKKNINKLRDAGFIYPLFSSDQINTRDIANHSIPVFSLFTKKPESYLFNMTHRVTDFDSLHRQYMSTLEQCMATGSHVILSGEDISILSETELKKLSELLFSYADVVVPLVAVRSPYEFSCSSAQQVVKSGRYIDYTYFPSQIENVQKVRKVFPDTVFIPFRRMCQHESGPVGYLLEMMGVSTTGIEIVYVNEGAGNTVIRAQNEINRTNPRIISGEINERWVSVVDQGAHSFVEKFCFTKEEYEQQKDACDRENAFFRELLGDDFVDANIRHTNINSCVQELGSYLSSDVAHDKYVNSLRDAASKLEKDDLELAYQLVELAHKIRPQGPVIKKKLDAYKAKLRG